MFHCPSIMSQSTHLCWESIYSFSLYAYISVIGISLHIDNSIEYVRIDNCISNQIHPLNIRAVMSDSIS